MAPIVSVIMPVFNAERYVAQAVESVLAQTVKDLEVIVVIDGSTDHSSEVVKKFEDPRLRLMEHPTNLGIASARNTGLRSAKGQYIAFCDADDRWSSITKLQDQLLLLKSSDEAIGTYCAALVIDAAGRRIGRRACPKMVDRQRLKVKNEIVFSSLLIRRLDPLLLFARERHEDYLFLWLLCNFGRLIETPDVTVDYRRHSTNVTRHRMTSLFWHLRVQYRHFGLGVFQIICGFIRRIPLELGSRYGKP